MLKIIILLAILQNGASERFVRRYFDKLNNQTKNFKALGAELAWKISLNASDAELMQEIVPEFEEKYLKWHQETCSKLEVVSRTIALNKTQERMVYLLCRGPNYTLDEAKESNRLLRKLQETYSDLQVCIQNLKVATRDNLTGVEEMIAAYVSRQESTWNQEKIFLFMEPTPRSFCFRGEADFNRIMMFSRNNEVLKWVWRTWRNMVSDMKDSYEQLLSLQYIVAVHNGYYDIGEAWRKELEIPNVRTHCNQLYANIKPLYKLLHGVTRYFLRRKYGAMVPVRGPIPAHLLGDLWAQNWEPLADLILPKTIDLNKEMKEGKVKWDVNHMLKRAEDFYISLGLPAMTEAFWRESIFSRENYTQLRCHGTAADMYKDGDFRMIYCADVTFQDFQVLHHEMGHIQYYMAYEKQPAIFRQANAALHESIGDSVMYGAMTPQHLHRLGLVNDSVLYSGTNIMDELLISNISDIIKGLIDEDFVSEERTITPIEYMLGDILVTDYTEPELTADDILLLKQGLNKLPQITFAFAMDEFRWDYFEGRLNKEQPNKEFWSIMRRFQGVAPDTGREDGHYFDVGAKFHDNTPFVRYFLSSFLQHQLFESLCKAAVYGRRNVKDPIPSSISIHRCDIYGSKAAGKLLRDIMSRGDSQPLQEILKATIGDSEISSAALERYYRPLQEMLQRMVNKFAIPLGW